MEAALFQRPVLDKQLVKKDLLAMKQCLLHLRHSAYTVYTTDGLLSRLVFFASQVLVLQRRSTVTMTAVDCNAGK